MSESLEVRKQHVRFTVNAEEGQCPSASEPPDFIRHWWAQKYQTWEPETFRIFDAFLNRDQSYLDIGAWIGPTVLYGAAIAKRVVCLEPDPVAFAILSRNIALNPQYKNIVALEVALGDKEGECEFGGNGALGNSESTMLVREEGYASRMGECMRTGCVEEEQRFRQGARTVVRMAPIEKLDSEHGLADCTFVKMDIEGGEKVVIPAISAFLERNRPVLLISLHWSVVTRSEIEAVLDVLGKTYLFMYDENLCFRLNKTKISERKVSTIVCMPRALPWHKNVESLVRMFARKAIWKIRHLTASRLESFSD